MPHSRLVAGVHRLLQLVLIPARHLPTFPHGHSKLCLGGETSVTFGLFGKDQKKTLWDANVIPSAPLNMTQTAPILDDNHIAIATQSHDVDGETECYLRM